MKKRYQIDQQRAVQQFRRLATEQNPNIQMILPLGGSWRSTSSDMELVTSFSGETNWSSITTGLLVVLVGMMVSNRSNRRERLRVIILLYSEKS